MKKVFLSVAVVAAFALASCGGGASGDAKKLCDCMKGAVKDMSKMDECMKQAEEMEKKYKGNADAEKEIEKVMDECEKEMTK
ncbi:MAG: hypothetical protein ACOZCO_06010 [Bacteroidota bacterium]